MPEKMIINARRDLGRRHRIVSDLLTACLWGGWILLWIPAFRKLLEVIHLHLDFGLAAKEVLDTVTPISIARSLVALLGTSVLLLLWSLLPKRQVGQAHAFRSMADYASYFNLEERTIVDGCNSRICVVCHDEDGGITGIEVKS